MITQLMKEKNSNINNNSIDIDFKFLFVKLNWNYIEQNKSYSPSKIAFHVFFTILSTKAANYLQIVKKHPAKTFRWSQFLNSLAQA